MVLPPGKRSVMQIMRQADRGERVLSLKRLLEYVADTLNGPGGHRRTMSEKLEPFGHLLGDKVRLTEALRLRNELEHGVLISSAKLDVAERSLEAAVRELATLLPEPDRQVVLGENGTCSGGTRSGGTRLLAAIAGCVAVMVAAAALLPAGQGGKEPARAESSRVVADAVSPFEPVVAIPTGTGRAHVEASPKPAARTPREGLPPSREVRQLVEQLRQLEHAPGR